MRIGKLDEVRAPESGRSASPSSSGVTCLLEGHRRDRGEASTSRMCAPVCVLGGRARWQRACRGNSLEGRERNTSLNFPLPKSHTSEIEIIITLKKKQNSFTTAVLSPYLSRLAPAGTGYKVQAAALRAGSSRE